jgi:hypothetical protein
LDATNAVIAFALDAARVAADPPVIVNVNGHQIVPRQYPNVSIPLPPLPVGAHTLRVEATAVDGSKLSIDLLFYAWPPHAWTASIVAVGDGLSHAIATVPANFKIISRDAMGVERTVGGDAFDVRLVGPSLVGGAIKDNRDGSYGVSYRVDEPGIVCGG